MIKNYLKIAFRNFVQHKSFAVLSVLSLAIAFTSVILIGMYVKQEFSYDRFHEKSDQIYRLTTISKNADNERSVGFVPLPLSEHLAGNFSSVVNFARVWEYRRSMPVSNPELDLVFYEDDFKTLFLTFLILTLLPGIRKTRWKVFAAWLSQNLPRKSISGMKTQLENLSIISGKPIFHFM